MTTFLKRRYRKSGISLLEVSIALAILAFGLGGVVQLHIQTNNSASEVHKRIVAESLVAKKAQETKAAGFQALKDYLASHAEETNKTSAVFPAEREEIVVSSSDAKDIEFYWQAQLEAMPGNPDCIRIVSLARWISRGRERETQCRIFVHN